MAKRLFEMSDDKENKKRVRDILRFVIGLASNRFNKRLSQSEKGDDLDAIIEGLNMLADEFSEKSTRRKWSEAKLNEHEKLLKGLVKERTSELERTVESLKKEIKVRKEMEEKFKYLAYYDDLTKLSTRTVFEETLEKVVSRSKRYKRKMALLYIDVDFFKDVNDSFEHAVGDQLLVELSQRLQLCLRKGDMASRVGGDEFTVILEEIDNPQYAGFVAKKIMDVLSMPYVLNGEKVSITTSIGITVFPYKDQNEYDLVRNADKAMYSAKKRGRDNYQFYSEELNASNKRYLEVAEGLQTAIIRNEFFLFYQPQVDLKTLQLVGIEVFLQWDSPVLGRVSPSEFVHIAEETDFILELSQWVLETAAQQYLRWRKMYPDKFANTKLSFNVSAAELGYQHFLENVISVLKKAGLEGNIFSFEITEEAFMKSPATATKTLDGLRKIGTGIVADDFGLGYSSLTYLNNLPATALKVDQSFVQGIGESTEKTTILLSTLALARNLKLRTIAEGVETKEQLMFLKKHNCNYVQGKYITAPLDAAEMDEFLLD